jgi:hypothetical protein
MKKIIKAGATSQTIDLFIQDSASTTGGGKTGLAYNTASLTAYYRKGATGTPTAITLATQTVGGAYSSGGFVEIDGTNMPGMYRLDLPNAVVDTAGSVTLMLKGASGMAPLPIELQVIAADLDDATALGLSRLDAAIGSRLATAGYTAPLDAAGTRTAVGLASANLDTQIGTLATASALATVAGYVDTEVAAILSAVDTEVAAIKAKTDNLPAAPAATGDCLTAAGVRAAVGLASANLDTQIGTLATASALATVAGYVDTEVGTLQTTATAIKARTDLIPAAPAAVGDIPTATQNADALLLRDWTAIVATVPARSALNALRWLRNRWSIVGGLLTVTKEDDATTAWTAVVSTDAAADPVTGSDPT